MRTRPTVRPEAHRGPSTGLSPARARSLALGNPRGGSARRSWGGHNGAVKFRIGLGIGVVVGYLLGARAGRERYLEVVRLAGRVGRSGPVSGTTSLVTDKSRAAAHLGIERLKDTIGVRLGWRDGDDAADAIVLDLAEEVAIAMSNRRNLPEQRMHHPAATAAHPIRTGPAAEPVQASSR